MNNDIVGLRSWNGMEYYSINAKAEDGVLLTREAVRPRRRLLEDAFDGVTERVDLPDMRAASDLLCRLRSGDPQAPSRRTSRLVRRQVKSLLQIDARMAEKKGRVSTP